MPRFQGEQVQAGGRFGGVPVEANRVVPFDPGVDKRRGAPAGVRAAVGAAERPEDRLATIRKFYPDAQPYGSDNFVFTDPQTGRATLYNPPGPDFGDVPSVGAEIAEFAGGIVGGAAAVPPAVAGAVPTGGTSLLAVPAGVGLGAAAGREMYQTMAPRIMGTVDTRSLPERLGAAAMTATGNAVGQRLGDVVGPAAKSVFGPVTHRHSTGTTPQLLKSDFAQLGVDPLAGPITGNRATQLTEQWLANTPGGASVMQDVIGRTLDQLSDAAGRTSRAYAQTDELLTPEGIGETVQRGARAATERFTSRQDQLYGRAYDLIRPDSRVPVQTVQALYSRLQQQLAQAPESLGPQARPALQRIEALIRDAGNAGVPFAALRQIRTDLGRQIGDPVLVGENSAQRQYLQQLYGALTEDINAFARATSPQAATALETANRYTRMQMRPGGNIEMLNSLIDKGIPEQAYRAVFGGVGSAGGANNKVGGTTLRRLRQNLRPEEWDLVAGSVLGRMGMARPSAQADTATEAAAEAFSPQTFMTNWNSLSPEARRALFAGTRYQELVPQLDALVRVVDSVKKAEQMGNPSGTARMLIMGAGLGSAGTQVFQGDLKGAAVTIAGPVAASWAAAKLLTNPRFVQWLTSTSQKSLGGRTITGDFTRLLAIAEANPELRGEITQYLDAVRTIDAGARAEIQRLRQTAPPERQGAVDQLDRRYQQ